MTNTQKARRWVHKPVNFERFEENVWFDMTEITFDKWFKLGVEKYGEDPNAWRYKCPACGHISSGKDFIVLGLDPEKAYLVCIGRVNGKGVDGMHEEDQGSGCNWAAGGLFGTLGKGFVVNTPDGRKVPVFPFAD